MKTNKFKITCTACGSENVKVTFDIRDSWGGYDYQVEFTGKLEFECLECKECELSDSDI